MQRRADEIRRGGKTIAFVPTMGFLHEGHLSLVRIGKQHADEVVVSIFVNPAQFGPGEDLAKYPKAFEKDCEMCASAGAAVVFAPRADEMYPPGYETYVSLEKLPGHLCGLSRPVHFRGVATVVSKLFHMVKPHAAVFGEKDFQQLQVIRRMVRDLNFDIRIIGAPTVREPDGLAMSSRNTYLKPHERIQALCLSRSLQQALEEVKNGERDADKIIASARNRITAQPDAVIDYVAVCNPDTLEPVGRIAPPALMALAVKIGATRLIDNVMLSP